MFSVQLETGLYVRRTSCFQFSSMVSEITKPDERLEDTIMTHFVKPNPVSPLPSSFQQTVVKSLKNDTFTGSGYHR